MDSRFYSYAINRSAENARNRIIAGAVTSALGVGSGIWNTAKTQLYNKLIDAATTGIVNYAGNQVSSRVYPEKTTAKLIRKPRPRYSYRPSKYYRKRNKWVNWKRQYPKHWEKYKYYKYWYYNQ